MREMRELSGVPKGWPLWRLALLCAANDVLLWILLAGAGRWGEAAGGKGIAASDDAAAGIFFEGGYSPPAAGRITGLYLSLSLLAGCLMISCITDLMTFRVYNFVWWIGGLGAGGILICTREHGNITALLLFCLLQQFFFSRMYGRADCHAFCVCAAAEYALGMGMLGYLVQMLLAYILLAVVQGVKRNINRKGNLKAPKAFLPYITLSFWIHLLLYSCGILPLIYGNMH